MPFSSEHDFRIDDRWLVQPRRNQIRLGDAVFQIEPKVMDVLVCLARRPGDVVSKDELMDAVWTDTVVVEKVVTRAISELRKVLGDDARAPHVIETIPTVGYRLMAPVSFSYGGDSAPPPTLSVDVPTASEAAPPLAPRLSGPALASVVGVVVLVAGLGWYLVARSSGAPSPPVRTVPLTSYAGHELQPALSPDGQMVAFIWNKGQGQGGDLYVTQATTEQPLRLTEHAGWESNPVWSGDGEEVAFLRYGRTGCEGIFVVSALGGTARKLADCPRFTMGAFDWSVDGRTLALAVYDTLQGNTRLLLHDVKAGTSHVVTQPPENGLGDADPVFSPDGRQIAFSRRKTPRTQDLFVLDLASETTRRLTFDDRDLKSYAWTPEGTHIVFSSDRGGSYTLWRVRADGEQVQVVTPGGWNLKEPSIAAGRLAYERWLYDTNVWRVVLDSLGEAPPTQVVASTLWDQEPSFSPDGSRLAFVSNRSGTYAVWTSYADGSDPVQLTAFDGPVVAAPRWSPDGRHLVFVAYPAGFAEVHVIDAQGGTPRPLIRSQGGEYQAPSWSPDGQWVYFGSNRSGTWQIWKIRAEGGEPVQVTTDGGARALVAPDGQMLYVTKRDAPGIWRQPVAGGPAERIIDDVQPFDGGNWDLARDGLYYVVRHRSSAALYRYDFTDQSADSLGILGQNLMWHQASLALAPDGHSLLYTMVDRNESDLLLLEGFR